MVRTIRSAGVFLLCILVAVGTQLLVKSPIPRKLMLQWSLWTNVGVDGGLSAVGAFILGYALYGAWKRAEMKWIWLAGAAWCGVGLLRASLEPRSVLDADESYNIFGGITRADIQDAMTWTVFVLPFIRTLFYSAGAAVKSRIIRSRNLPRDSQVVEAFESRGTDAD